MNRFALILLMTFVWVGQIAHSQATGFTSLIADNIQYNRLENTITATGNVLISFEETTIEASQIIYNAQSDTISAIGPIRLTDGRGTVFIADMAELSSDLREGVIRGARLLLSNEFQISVGEVRRNAGRFNTFYHTAASSCRVCLNRPTPMWQIRARRIIHDTEARLFYFEKATFEAFGLPILYLPRIRMYEPSIQRATGLLSPNFVSSNVLGYGVKLPFFMTLGEHSDVTITPYINANGAFLVESEFRKRLHNGSIDIHGAFALSDGDGGWADGFLDAQAVLNMSNGLQLYLDANVTNDDGFMRKYGYNDADRLVTNAGLRRFSENSFLIAQGLFFQSLRDDEIDAETPFALPEVSYRKTWTENLTGGRVGIGIETVGLYRKSGRDIFRVSALGDWRRDWNAPLGLRVSTFANTQLDLYRVWDDPGFSNNILFRLTPTIGAEISLPLIRISNAGVSHVIKPTAQVIYTPNFSFNDDVPNEDSLQIEFDETNLFAINRFPGMDQIETGFRANIGVNYRRYDPTGWTMGVDIGQVFRISENNQFSTGSGLAGPQSDLLAAVSFELPPNIRLVNRLLIGKAFEIRRAETELFWTAKRFEINGSFVYLAPDVAADSPDARSEINLGLEYQFLPNWRVIAEWRRDLITNDDIYARLGLTYGNECVELDVSLSRRFTNSISVPAETSVDISVRLAGFGGGLQNRWAAQTCMQMQ